MPIGVVLLIVLLNMTAFRGSKVLVTLFAVELGISQLFVGALIAVYSVFPMLLGLYAGKLTDRLGFRLPMTAGSIGVATALAVPYFFPGVSALFASAALIGASWVFYNVCVQNLVGVLSTVETRARNFTNYGLAMAGGTFFGPMLAGFSIDHFGHAQSYAHIAALPLITAIILIAMRSFRSELGKGQVKEEHAAYGSNLLSNKPLRRTLITAAIILTGTDLFQFYMPIYGHSIGLSASTIGMILGTFAIAAFVVRLAMTRMIKRLGADTLLVGSLFIGAASYLAFPLFENAYLLAAVAFVLGLGLGCSQPLSLMLIYDRAPQGRSGEALGLRHAINNFMHIAIPLFFGSLGTVFGVAPVFLANAAIMAAGGVISRNTAGARAA